MEDIEKIRKEFRNYLKEQAKLKGLSKKDTDTQYSDADYPRKHADELGIDYWKSFKNDQEFKNLLLIIHKKFTKTSSFSPYKRALNSFRNFINERYLGVDNLIDKFTSLSVNSYEQLIISYLEIHGKTTIDELFEYISSIKNTGKTGKRYLREVVTNRYQGSDIFEYDNPFVWLKNNDKVDCTLPEELNENIKYIEGTSKTIVVNAYERNVKAKKACIEYYGNDYKCQICGFKFADKYGAEFRNKIHVHHIKPISEIGKEYKIDPKKDLIPVCPNCHMILHSKGNGQTYSVEEVKAMLKNNL